MGAVINGSLSKFAASIHSPARNGPCIRSTAAVPRTGPYGDDIGHIYNLGCWMPRTGRELAVIRLESQLTPADAIGRHTVESPASNRAVVPDAASMHGADRDLLGVDKDIGDLRYWMRLGVDNTEP